MIRRIEKLRVTEGISDYPHDIAKTVNEIIEMVNAHQVMLEQAPDFAAMQAVARDEAAK